MRRFPAAAAALVALAAAAPLAAQDTLRLSLDEAIELALDRNPQHRQVVNDVDAAAAQTRAAWGGFLPSLNGNLGFNGSESTVITGTDNFGNPIRRDDPLTSKSSSARQGVSASLTLFDGGATLANLRAARASESAAGAAVEAGAAQLRAQVMQRYYAAVKADRQIELEERLLAAAVDQLDRTERQFRIAAASQADVLGARSEVLAKEQTLIQAQAQAEIALLTLRQTLGLEDPRPLALDTELPTVFDPSELSADDLVARATSVHPQVLAAEARASAADRQASAAAARRWPTITAGASFSRSMGLPNYNAIGEFDPQNRSFGFDIGVQVPIFQRFQTSASIAQAEATASDARESARQARLQIERDVRAGLIELQRAYRALELASEQATITQERLAMAQEQFRAGVIDFLQLQQILNSTEQSQRAAVDAQFTFIDALATLEERLGGPVR